jgi:FAD/FMN-containing dehydrogenase
VHGERLLPRPSVAHAVIALHERLRDEFDPARRLNPGRSPLMTEQPAG